MNFYDVLAAEKWGGGIPTINFFDLLFAQLMGGGEQWQTYEGTLPATINANGDDMRQYQVHGATGGVGDRTVNLFDKNAKDTSKGYVSNAMIVSNGDILGNNNFYISEYIAISPANSYNWKWISAISQATVACLTIYDANKNAIATLAYKSNVIITIPSGAYYCRLSVHMRYADISMLTTGTTPPETYVPYGYEVDMGVSSPNMINVEPFKVDKQQTSRYVSLYSGKLKPGNYTVAILQENSITGSLRNTLTVQIGTSSIFENATNNYHNNLGWHYLTFTVSNEQSNSSIIIQFWANNLNDDCNYSSAMLLNGSVRPNAFIPYYNMVTPIYIGDTPLEKDEYVDYAEQKVYKKIGNLFNNVDFEYGVNLADTGATAENINYMVSDYVPVSEGTYTISENQNVALSGSSVIRCCSYDENKAFIKLIFANTRIGTGNFTNTFLIEPREKFIRCSFRKTDTEMVMNVGATALPYLQPTDPPVLLPALPTCEGTTIVDYAGSGTAPEKVYFEYQGGKQP